MFISRSLRSWWFRSGALGTRQMWSSNHSFSCMVRGRSLRLSFLTWKWGYWFLHQRIVVRIEWNVTGWKLIQNIWGEESTTKIPKLKVINTAFHNCSDLGEIYHPHSLPAYSVSYSSNKSSELHLCHLSSSTSLPWKIHSLTMTSFVQVSCKSVSLLGPF